MATAVAPAAKAEPKVAAKVEKPVKTERFIIECTNPVQDGILDTSALEQYFHDKIKVNGKAGNLGTKVTIERDQNSRVIVVAQHPFSKRYLKFLTKRFLKKQGLRDWIRVVASSKDTYTLKYYNIQDDEAQEEEEK